MINIVIPAAGEGSRFKQQYKEPKPLIFLEKYQQTMIELVIDNITHNNFYNNQIQFTFLFQEKHLNTYPITKTIKEKLPTANIIPIKDKTQGSIATLLNAEHIINNNDPLFILNSDQYLDIHFEDYMKYSLNKTATIMVFPSNDPKYSYAEINDHQLIKRTKEKEVISKYATTGVYFWLHGNNFIESANKMIENKDTYNNEYYTCPTFNYLNQPIYPYYIRDIEFWCLGTPEDLDNFNKYYI